MKRIPIGTVVERVETCNPAASFKGSDFKYIDISSIDRESKEIREVQVVPAAEAPSRARQLVRAGDVLVSTVRPNLNGVAVVPLHLDGAVASTGFTVLRVTPNSLDGRFLFNWVKTPSFIDALVSRATGASYPAVSDSIVKDSLIPLPSLDEQRRVAATLDKADAIRQKRKEAIGLTDAFIQSVFAEMFGDPDTNPFGWESMTLASISTKVTDGEHATPQRVEEGIKLLSARNVKNGYIDLEPGVDYVPEHEWKRISKRCNPERGDILISCSGTIGRVAVVDVDEPLSLVRSVALVKLDSSVVRPHYLEYLLRTPSLQRRMKASSKQSSQANLFTGQIKELPVLVPPVAQQDRFISVFQMTRSLAQRQTEFGEDILRMAEALRETLFRESAATNAVANYASSK